MDHTDFHPPDDYSHRFFIWPDWIQANGPLTADNIFDYFATSMFYDKQSNNQVLRMQTMHTGMPIANEAEELRRFVGVEFALVHSRPPSLFVIHKRERLSPTETRPLAAYFVMNNRIYQSPDMYNILQNRLLTSLTSLQSSMDTLRNYRPDYTPRTGFAWSVAELPIPENLPKRRRADDDAPPPSDSQLDLPQPSEKGRAGPTKEPSKQQNLALLYSAMLTTARHSQQTFKLQSKQTTGPDSAMADTPINPSTSTGRLSSTPAPLGFATANLEAPVAQEPPLKAPPGAGKKKKKRLSIPAPAGS